MNPLTYIAEIRGAALRVTALALFLGLFALALPGPSSAAREESADLTFIKLEETRAMAGRDVVCEWYTVEEDDVLWKIYRKRSLIDLGGFHRWTEEVKKLNPHVDDINLIYPGQKILIPVREAGAKPGKPVIGGLHRVKRGDTVVGILRRMGLPYRVIYNEYLQMVRALNPEIKDINLIFPGQVVRIPTTPQMAEARPSVARRAAAGEKGVGSVRAKGRAPKPEPPEKKRPSPPQAIERGTEEEAKEDLPIIEEWRRSLADTIGAVAEGMGGRYTDEGRHYIPLYLQGQVNLDARLFPLIELDQKVRVILDLKGRLPQDLVEALSGKYRRYQIVTLEAGDNVRTLLGKVLPLLGRVSRSSPREPYTISRSVGLEGVADWVVEMEEIPGKGRRVGLISMAVLPEEVADQDLASYLHTQGVAVVDLLATGGAGGYRVFSGRKSYREPPSRPVAVDADSPSAAARTILDVLGVEYESGKTLDLKSGDRTGFYITVETDILITKNGTGRLLDYGRLSSSLMDLLKKNGYTILRQLPDVKVEENLREILTFLGYDFKRIVRFSTGSKPRGRSITVTATGMLFHREGTENWFMTFLRPHPGLNAFLRSRNIKPIFIMPVSKK